METKQFWKGRNKKVDTTLLQDLSQSNSYQNSVVQTSRNMKHSHIHGAWFVLLLVYKGINAIMYKRSVFSTNNARTIWHSEEKNLKLFLIKRPSFCIVLRRSWICKLTFLLGSLLSWAPQQLQPAKDKFQLECVHVIPEAL